MTRFTPFLSILKKKTIQAAYIVTNKNVPLYISPQPSRNVHLNKMK